MNSPHAIDLRLPWQIDKDQDERFKRALERVVIPLLLLLLLLKSVPYPEREFEEKETGVEKTEIVLKPIVIEPEPEPTVTPKKPRPKNINKPIQKKIDKPKKAVDPIKEKKKQKIEEAQGISAISSELNSLMQQVDLTQLQQKTVSTSQGGEIARANSTVLGEDALTQKSQGIQVDDSVMKQDNVALAEHSSTEVDGFIDDGAPSAEFSNFYSDLKGMRSDESIRRIIEAGKSRANMNYQRALRDNPGLAGVLVFELVIQPDGSVTDLKLISSELKLPALEEQILTHVRKMNFGAEEVSPRRVKYKFNFLPN